MSFVIITWKMFTNVHQGYKVAILVLVAVTVRLGPLKTPLTPLSEEVHGKPGQAPEPPVPVPVVSQWCPNGKGEVH